MKNFNIVDYNAMLLNLLPHLQNCTSLSGADGTAYMINEKYVVKEITSVNDAKIFDNIFELYCKEIQAFANQNLNVPQIYSWLKVPTKSKNVNGLKFKYYILQERIAGRELYFSASLKDIYNCCKHICSWEEFDSVRKLGYNPLRTKVVTQFIQDYININEQLESMPDSDLEKFVVSIYKMAKQCKYSIPDTFCKNILIDNQPKLNIIDNSPICKPIYDANITSPAEFTLYSLVELLSLNTATKNSSLALSEFKHSYTRELAELVKKNDNLCKAILNRFIKILNKLPKDKVHDNKCFCEIKLYLHHLFGKDAEKVIEQIELLK